MLYTRHFSEINMNDVPLVGGKNASLGEMYSSLSSLGIKVPNGFTITADGYRHFIDHNDLQARIEQALSDLDTHNVSLLSSAGASIRELIMHGDMPGDLVEQICRGYEELAKEYGTNPDVAVRSSATAEDLPGASFAGQQETYLNIRGAKNLVTTCRQVFASLFTDRAISYRVDKGFTHMDVALSIGIQKMVRSDIGCSGVMFTIDTETGFRDAVFITAAYGLGENIVQGKVNPDEYYVFKSTLEKGFRPIIKRQLGDKAIKMIYTSDNIAGISTRNVHVQREGREKFALTDDEVLELAHYGVVIEQHYSKRAGQPMPMDIEWAKDGKTNELFILQARPETVQAVSDAQFRETFILKTRGNVLTKGKSVGQRIATGNARVILEAAQMGDLKPGEILVSDITDPDWEPVMKIAAGIVTNRGGRTCHAAIVARELGIPAVVGCDDATQVINTGQTVTVSCAEGDTGFIYDGKQEFEKQRIDLSDIKHPATNIMVNIANPEQAFEVSKLPCDGVGLARLEFIINTSIRVHPRALIEYDTLDKNTKKQIDQISAGYPDRKAFYVQRMAEGIGMIGAAFYPRPVIVRFSDFKSNEYASLIGGSAFEPDEENPMIGFRGAGRYYSSQFEECFILECQAIKAVRETMGLDNIAVMIPFVRTVEESMNVLQVMAKHGLKRDEHGLRIYMMCEIPANALLADEFLKHFDGFSIGSNDLTQLTLGVDRDSSLVTSFDERNPAVLNLMEMAIKACKKNKKYIGICGQAPSDYPEIAKWLVQHGIDSVSLNPDSVLSITQVINKIEQQIKRG